MFNVLVVSQIEKIFEGRAESVVLPGYEGEFEIMDFHHDIVSLLIEGNIVIDNSYYPIKKGIAKFCNNEMVALIER